MEKSDWLRSIREKRRRQILRVVIFVISAEALWFVIYALGMWAWVFIFHRLPPAKYMASALVALGTAIVGPLAAIAPLAPMRGKDPEVIAADEFFKGPPH